MSLFGQRKQANQINNQLPFAHCHNPQTRHRQDTRDNKQTAKQYRVGDTRQKSAVRSPQSAPHHKVLSWLWFVNVISDKSFFSVNLMLVGLTFPFPPGWMSWGWIWPRTWTRSASCNASHTFRVTASPFLEYIHQVTRKQGKTNHTDHTWDF